MWCNYGDRYLKLWMECNTLWSHCKQVLQTAVPLNVDDVQEAGCWNGHSVWCVSADLTHLGQPLIETEEPL